MNTVLSDAAMIERDPRWADLLARNRDADGRFVYSVRSTGVYCRPSCGARRPLPQNVRFHATATAAEAAGFRACRRCRPDREPSPEQAPLRFAVADCALGYVLVAASERGVCAILLGDDADALARELQQRWPRAPLHIDACGLAEAMKQVQALLAVPQRALTLPLDLRGTPFQRRVWQALQAIPAGHTASYTDIAQRIDAPTAARAVAAACAANALAVVIPCHRVVRSDGALAGYCWGVARKRALLAREARA